MKNFKALTKQKIIYYLFFGYKYICKTFHKYKKVKETYYFLLCLTYYIYGQSCVNLLTLRKNYNFKLNSICDFIDYIMDFYSEYGIKANADFPKNWQYTFTKPGSLGAESIQIFHNDLWLVLGVIFCIVFYVGIESIIRFKADKKLIKKSRVSIEKKARLIEFFWTILPLLTVCIIIIPSIALTSTLEPLSVTEENVSDEIKTEKNEKLPMLSINVTGNQWFWQYQIHLGDVKEFLDLPKEFLETYSSYFEKPITIDSYLMPKTDLQWGELRGLSAVKKLVLPEGYQVRVTGNSADVIHSWAVHGLETKMDMVPGRSTIETLLTTSPGLFKGQCSEICGAFHGFMPIDIEVVPMEDFSQWVKNVVLARAKQDGFYGFYRYLMGDHGTSTYLNMLFPEIIGPIRHNDFIGRKWDEIYNKQAKILHGFRLKNQLLESLGFTVDHDERHLILDLKNPIRDFSPGGDPTYAIKVDDSMYHDWLLENKKMSFERVWFDPKKINLDRLPPDMKSEQESIKTHIEHDYIHTTVRPSESSKPQFPWKRGEIPYIEPNYISHDYGLVLPHAMSFVSCHNQCYGPNFTSWDNTEGNVWYFRWYTSSLWIDGTEYRHLYDFPQKWGFNKELVLPVVPKAYIGDSGIMPSKAKLGQELGYRFVTKKIRCPWSTREVDTVLVQSFSGHLYDTGVPIDEIWCAKFRFVTVPPLKYIGTRNFSM